MVNLFDGPLGGLVAGIMARGNAEAEAEAIAILAPAPDAAILVIGFGPGVGAKLLAERLPRGRVLGVDPSAAMLRQAQRRNRAAIAEGRVELQRTTAAAVPTSDASLDGAVAVNALQLCNPIESTATELARILRPGARLVSLTHNWAAAHHAGDADAWLGRMRSAFQAAGFVEIEEFRARAEKGRSVAFNARRAG
jgi:ubiquinone/menaquinone biosynthesis C-methylase UbiE